MAEIAAAFVAREQARTRWWMPTRSALGHVARLMGWVAFHELRRVHGSRYAARRAEEKAAPGTVAQEITLAGAALAWWADEHDLPRPRLARPPKPAPRRRWLTEAEADRLVAACASPHVRLFVILALGTGARKGALLELSWSAVDLERRVVDLGGGQGQKGRAVLPIAPELADELARAQAVAASPWVIEWAGRRVRRIEGAFNAARRRAGLEDVTPHDLRRTAGSWLLQRGVPIQLVSRLLGHRSIRTTETVYAHLAVEHLREAATLLGKTWQTTK